MATLRKRYVDPDVSGGAGNGTSWANAYASLNAAEQAEDDTGDIVSRDEYVEFVCGHNGASQSTEDTAAVDVSSWTTDATRFIKIYTETADRHPGKWSTTKYRLGISNAVAIRISEDYVRIDGLQIRKTGNNGNDQSCITYSTVAASNANYVSNCLLVQYGGSTYREPNLFVNDPDTILTCWNCILYGMGNVNSTANAAVYVGGNGVSLYSCTVIGNLYGIRVVGTGLTAVAKNCYFYGATAAVSLGTSSVLTSTSCAANDTTLNGTDDHDNVAKDTDTFVNVSAGSEDFHLAADGLSPLQGHGATLIDDPPGSTELALDIDGETRTVTWDIGADEWISTGRTTKNTRSHALGIALGVRRTVPWGLS